MRNKPLQGQAALVTGANSGIGEAVARCFAEAGARVAINYVVHPEAASAIVEDIKRKGGDTIALKAGRVERG
jgi:glucose 1-dehydrogenase